ncbi:MAG TPA: caspase family protein [Pyrinomonadaceae bacterium]
MSGKSPKLYAVLIGIDCYLRGKLPDGSYYRSLNGCVNDITRTERFLRDRLGLTDEQIFKLTASNTQEGLPAEPPEQWPTYENIIALFERVTSAAAPGDQIYVHYSGHGGRTKTMFPELKGKTGLDEALVPTDICRPEARYLRDVELTHLLKTMVDARLVVTVVLDSCHSGSATRGDGGATLRRMTVRGASEVDITPRSTESLVASKAELLASWRGLLPEMPSAIKPGGGWVPEPAGYVLLAACRSFEGAHEYAFDGGAKSGALTYWLLDSLRQTGPQLTYRMLHNRIVAKVHAMFSQQTPQLQGEADRVVFGSERLRPQPSVNVLEADPEQQRVRLSTGVAQGVGVGARFAVYAPGAADYTKVEERLAVVEVETPGTTSSWAAVSGGRDAAGIEAGAQAVLLDVGAFNPKGRVTFVRNEELPSGVDQDAALGQVESLLARERDGWLLRAGLGEASDFQVVVNAAAEYELWDPLGNVIPRLGPGLKVADPASPSKLLSRLIHLTKYRNVRLIDNDELSSGLAQALICEASRKATTPAPGEQARPLDAPGHTPTLRPGEWLFLRLKNNSNRALNITILDLRPNWSIKQLFPAFQDFEPFEPGQEQVLTLRAALPASYDDGTDVFKVFATVEPTSFRWLELPPLDAPPGPGAALRAPVNSLEELLAMYAAGEATARDAELVCAFTDWATAAVEMTVRRV